jgi:hypothetical protein
VPAPPASGRLSAVHIAMPTAQFMVLLASVGAVLVHVGTGHFDFDLRPLALVIIGIRLVAAPFR